MNKVLTIVLASLLSFVLLIGVVSTVFFRATPTGREIYNTYFHRLREADDDTLYETRKKVEDTCRAMISSYNSDKLTYEQYKESESTEKQGWAEQAKMRANKTASTYNNYILKNNYVWKNDVPKDIFSTLEYIE